MTNGSRKICRQCGDSAPCARCAQRLGELAEEADCLLLTPQEIERRALQRALDDYLARGGQVLEVRAGVTGNPDALSHTRLVRRAAKVYRREWQSHRQAR